MDQPTVLRQQAVLCPRLPRNTRLERGELKASPWALEALLARCGRVAAGARKGRCGCCGGQRGAAAQKGAVAHRRGLSAPRRPRGEEREVTMRSLYYVVLIA